jgi:hypothetical protein
MRRCLFENDAGPSDGETLGPTKSVHSYGSRERARSIAAPIFVLGVAVKKTVDAAHGDLPKWYPPMAPTGKLCPALHSATWPRAARHLPEGHLHPTICA